MSRRATTASLPVASRPAILGMVFCLLLQSSNATAYLDPNAGGMIFQILFPVFAAVLGWWALFKRKITDIAAVVWSRIRGKTAMDESNST